MVQPGSEANLNDTLEALIDRHGLAIVLDTIAGICDDKAEHIRHTWQDANTARPWTWAAQRIENVSAFLTNLDRVQFTR